LRIGRAGQPDDGGKRERNNTKHFISSWSHSFQRDRSLMPVSCECAGHAMP
jgi:hypothetical protein